MSSACSDVQLDRQRVELLPARTLLSTFVRGTAGSQHGDSTDPIGALFNQIHILKGVLPSGPGGAGGPTGDPGNATGGV